MTSLSDRRFMARIQGLIDAAVSKSERSHTPAGVTMIWWSDDIPNGWFLLNGQAISRTAYPRLFAMFGETHGAGDGTTTFNLPNPQGCTVVAKDPTQFEFDTLGLTGGAKTHTLTTAEMPNHNHAWSGVNDSAATSGQPGTYSFRIYQDVAINWTGTRSAMSGEGGGGAHNNLQPYQVVNLIIKAG